MIQLNIRNEKECFAIRKCSQPVIYLISEMIQYARDLFIELPHRALSGFKRKTENRETFNCRSGTVNSKSFVGKVLFRIKWEFELNRTL